MASERRWISLRRQGTITPVASTQSYALTSLTGFNYPVRVFYLINGIPQDITVVSDEQWAQNNDNDSTGNPEICAFWKYQALNFIFPASCCRLCVFILDNLY